MKYFKYLVSISPLAIVSIYILIGNNFERKYQKILGIYSENENYIQLLKQEVQTSRKLVSESKFVLDKSNETDSIFVINKSDSRRIDSVIEVVDSLINLDSTFESGIKLQLNIIENSLEKLERKQESLDIRRENLVGNSVGEVATLNNDLEDRSRFTANKLEHLEQELLYLRFKTDSLLQIIKECNCNGKGSRFFRRKD
ncbi:MAG: hypothetical protein AAGH46_07280 [Bacteroidota bacterium]